MSGMAIGANNNILRQIPFKKKNEKLNIAQIIHVIECLKNISCLNCSMLKSGVLKSIKFSADAARTIAVLMLNPIAFTAKNVETFNSVFFIANSF